jgi:hypothetical protein
MEVEISPRTGEPFRLTLDGLEVGTLRLIVRLLRSANEGGHSGEDPTAREMHKKLERAVRSLSREVRDAINLPEKNAPACQAGSPRRRARALLPIISIIGT